MDTFRKFSIWALLVFAPAGCASMPGAGSGDRIPGIVHSDCGSAEGGAVHVALDAGDEFVIVNADGSWGRGRGEKGWTLQKDWPSADFNIQVCADQGFGCETPMEAHFALESGGEKAIDGTISYRTAKGAKEFRFRAVRTDLNEPMQLCG
jgi:hypothetical protein